MFGMNLKQILRDSLASKYEPHDFCLLVKSYHFTVFINFNSKYFIFRYDSEDVRTLLRTSTMLDPRFKTLGYADDEVKEEVCEKITKSLEEIYNEHPLIQDPAGTPNKKARLSGT